MGRCQSLGRGPSVHCRCRSWANSGTFIGFSDDLCQAQRVRESHLSRAKLERRISVDGRPCAVPRRRKGCRLWSAPERGAKTRGLGGGGRRKERHIRRLGRANRTHWATIDSRRPDAREKPTVVKPIPADASPLGFLDIKHLAHPKTRQDRVGRRFGKHDAWVHVDGAFGLWAATSPKYRHLSRGVEIALDR